MGGVSQRERERERKRERSIENVNIFIRRESVLFFFI